MAAIVTKDLVHSYKRHFWEQPKRALSGLNLTVEEGEIFGYLGANGAGKTTTIKILVGLQRQTGGDATLFGRSVCDVEGRRAIGFQPENPYFYEYLSARESMHFYGALCDVPVRERSSRTDELLAFVGLTEAADVRVIEFSKGMRQRLGIAQALVSRPRLVIFDEPMSGLDPVGRSQVRQAILTLKEQGLTVFFSSHVLADVEMICDRVGLLKGGILQACGPLTELLQTENRHIKVGAEKVPAACAEALSAEALTAISRGGEQVWEFQDWPEADKAVAALQKAGAHLTLLQPVGETLEEYFMRTTGEKRSEVGAWRGGGDA